MRILWPPIRVVNIRKVKGGSDEISATDNMLILFSQVANADQWRHSIEEY